MASIHRHAVNPVCMIMSKLTVKIIYAKLCSKFMRKARQKSSNNKLLVIEVKCNTLFFIEKLQPTKGQCCRNQSLDWSLYTGNIRFLLISVSLSFKEETVI